MKARLVILLGLLLIWGRNAGAPQQTDGSEISLSLDDNSAYAATNQSSLGTIEEGNSVMQPWPLPCIGNHDVRIEVLPNTPIEGEPITLLISGTSSDSCIPEYVTYEIQGNWIDVYAEELSCKADFCLWIVLDWAFDVALDSIPAGSYVVRFRLLCESFPPFPPFPNACSATPFTVIPCCDFDGDGKVDGDDILDIAARWHQAAGQPFDSDGDGIITIGDIMHVAALWGTNCQGRFPLSDIAANWQLDEGQGQVAGDSSELRMARTRHSLCKKQAFLSF